MVTDGTSDGGSRWPDGSLFQSFTANGPNLAAVDLLLTCGGEGAGKNIESRIRIRESSPGGNIVGTAVANIPPQVLGARVKVRFEIPEPIALRIGGVYVIDWTTPGPAILGWMGSQQDAYSGGKLFGPSGQELPDWDLAFTTFVGS